MADAGSGPRRDPPWVMRTYSGHSTARASNELYRTNIARGQTGLSIAFDLPTQTGYDPDDEEAAGEVGKVGVPVVHLGHMRQLLDGIPVADMNTSMTINATAAWLLGLYIANAQDQGVGPERLAGTTQNDIVKEYLLARHLHLPAPPEPAAHRRHHHLHRAPRAHAGTPSTSAATTSKRPARPPSRRSPTRWRRPSTCSTPSSGRARSTPRSSPTWSGASASS